MLLWLLFGKISGFMLLFQKRRSTTGTFLSTPSPLSPLDHCLTTPITMLPHHQPFTLMLLVMDVKAPWLGPDSSVPSVLIMTCAPAASPKGHTLSMLCCPSGTQCRWGASSVPTDRPRHRIQWTWSSRHIVWVVVIAAEWTAPFFACSGSLGGNGWRRWDTACGTRAWTQLRLLLRNRTRRPLPQVQRTTVPHPVGVSLLSVIEVINKSMTNTWKLCLQRLRPTWIFWRTLGRGWQPCWARWVSDRLHQSNKALSGSWRSGYLNQTANMSPGIDVDIDVEHEGQRTKVTPPPQSGGVEGDVEMDGRGSGGAKVSQVQQVQTWP